jgi:hypothetical protein
MLSIVRVDWIDPCFAKTGWMDKKEFHSFCRSNPSRTTSVGILAYQDKKSITILQSVGENSVADAVKINRASIVKIRKLAQVPDIEFAA